MRTNWKYNQNECRFSYWCFFYWWSFISKPLAVGKGIDRKNEILMCRKNLLKKLKSYIDNYLNTAKVSISVQRTENIAQPSKILQILAGLQIVNWDYYTVLSISKDDDFELYLKRKPHSCFLNNCFNHELKAWQANMDIQPAFNEFKAVIHMYSYFPKSEGQCSKAMQKVLKVAFQNNMHHYERMKTSSQAYLSKLEFSVQKAVYHILNNWS